MTCLDKEALKGKDVMRCLLFSPCSLLGPTGLSPKPRSAFQDSEQCLGSSCSLGSDFTLTTLERMSLVEAQFVPGTGPFYIDLACIRLIRDPDSQGLATHRWPGSQTSGSIFWELVRDAQSWDRLQTYRVRCHI